MKNKVHASVFPVLALLSGLLSILIASCGIHLPEIVPTRTSTSTPRPCPTIIINTPDALGFRKTIFVVLIQPNPHYAYSTQALEAIDHAIPRVIEPGDTFYMLRMGIFVSSFDSALLSHGNVADVPRPAIPATPTYIPSVTPTTAPIHTPQSGVAQQGATAQAEETVIALNATATQSAFVHNCALQEWKDRYEQQSRNWEATRTAVRGDFEKHIHSDIEAYEQQSDATPTALPNMVYESLEHATLIFKNYECGTDDRCFLIVFSDLSDPRYSTPEYIKEGDVDLTGVKIVSILFDCDPIFRPNCKSIQDRWTSNFASYNASSPPEYINGNDIEMTLVDILTRR